MRFNLIANKLVWKIREDGLLKMAKSSVLLGWRKIFLNQVEMVYMDCSGFKDQEYQITEHLEVERYDKREAVSPDFREALKMAIKKKYMQEKYVDYYLEKSFQLFIIGGVLWAAKYKKRLASYVWTVRGSYPTGFMFPIGSRDADLASGYTFPEYRGLGILPELYRYIFWQLGNEGVQRLFALVYVWNKPSIRALDKAGFEKVGRGRKMKIAGRVIVIWQKGKDSSMG